MKKLESFEILDGGKGIKINDLDLSDYPITRLRTEATPGYLEMHIHLKFRLGAADPWMFDSVLEKDQKEIEKEYERENPYRIEESEEKKKGTKPNVIKLRNGIFEGNTKNVLLFFCRKFEFFC